MASKSETISSTGTKYPTEFEAAFARIHGRPPTTEEILAAAPKSTSLFGGGTTQAGATQPSALDKAQTYPGETPAVGTTGGTLEGKTPIVPVAPAVTPGVAAAPTGLDKAQHYPVAQTPAAGATTAPAAVTTTSTQTPATAAGKTYTRADIGDALEGLTFRAIPIDQAWVFLNNTGLLNKPGGFTKEDVAAIRNKGDERYNVVADALYNELAAREQIAATPSGLTPSQPRGDPNAAIGGTDTALQKLGFGEAANVYAAPGSALSGVNQIAAPTAEAAQVATQGQDWEQFGKTLFESQYRPQEREILRQGEIADKRLQGELAAAGLATSGTGVGQLQKQRTEQQVTLQNVAKEAANTASVQQFGMKYAQDLQNAEFQQQTALANAGFDIEAQKTSSGNVLQGNMADAEAYLKTIGLNETTAAQGRADFLNLLGIQEQDLQRMDTQEHESLRLALNFYLQSLGAMGSIGEYSYGRGESSAKSTSVGVGPISVSV